MTNSVDFRLLDLDFGPLLKFENLSLGSQDCEFKQFEGLIMSEEEIVRGIDKQMC